MKARLLGLTLVVTWAGFAHAQQPTVVQLPTLSRFTARTTVNVPDRGSASLGAVNRAASGRNEFGTPLSPYRNRSFGAERSSSSMRVSAYIHDFQAMDEYLLGQPSSRSTTASATVSAPVAQVNAMRPVAAPRVAKSGPLAMSVAELRSRNTQAAVARWRQAEDYFQQGQTAEVAGKTSVAKTYYQMAARRATGDLKNRIAARLTLITTPAMSGM